MSLRPPGRIIKVREQGPPLAGLNTYAAPGFAVPPVEPIIRLVPNVAKTDTETVLSSFRMRIVILRKSGLSWRQTSTLTPLLVACDHQWGPQ